MTKLTSHSSTAFAIIRASSLGIVTTDLSYVYCWAAIWGDIEVRWPAHARRIPAIVR